ncbi:hypothetical protein DY000_02023482 [Brassica cretica]|uniref:Uncharacterized protein n=1 Tax=Brassica cretica TaxID=69181 RepID=A0ABQ7EII7_BRACR|nr:hypothetical protein DY000_02023482 [Brassica cretica]
METSIIIENNRLAVPGRIDCQTALLIVLREKSLILAPFFMPLPLVLQSSPELK